MKAVTYLKTIFSKIYYWRFALILALVMIIFEYTTIAGILLLTPAGHSWLGATITNSSDTAVYLNYLNQSGDSVLLGNLFTDIPHISRFDPFWSVGGLLVRFGASPVAAHEILRIVTTVILAFAVYSAAKSVAGNEKHARLASWLMLAGTSTGWLYSVAMSITNSWQFGSPVPSDLSNEFALAPILLGGAHMILSPALLLFNTRWIWEIVTGKKSSMFLPWISIAYHIGFHPYYLPIYGLISLFALIKYANKQSLRRFLILNTSLLPGFVYYLFLIYLDHQLREHHLVTNTLPLDAVWMWLIILLPVIIAFIWMLWNKVHLKQNNTAWIWAWFISAVICIFSPLPWNRKFLQAFLPGLVLLTLPFWLHISESLKPASDTILKFSLILLIGFPFLHLLQLQLALSADPNWNRYFYAPKALLKTWKALDTAGEDCVTVSTDLYACLWTPAYSGNPVWIGHNHETPSFFKRYAAYDIWRKTTDTVEFNEFLAVHDISCVIVHKTDYQKLFGDNWYLNYKADNYSLWMRKE